MKTALKTLFAALALYVAALVFAGPALASDCQSLTRLRLSGARVISAEIAPAGPMTTPRPARTPVTLDLPTFCRVKGRAAGSIEFEVWLPATGWNGRILSVGSAGFGGEQPLNALAEGLRRGYAVSGNDTGHQGSDPSWMRDPAKVRLWGHSATHLVIAPTRALVLSYYGAPARHAFFDGCSTGGAQAMAEAQFYPQDYDGIIAGAPGMSYAHLMISFLWGLHATSAGAPLSQDKLQLLHAAVLRACDQDDGLQDGLLGDPLSCRFDLTSLTCRSGEAATTQCLTAAEAATARRIYEGPRNPRTGAQIYPGFAYGSEAEPGVSGTWEYGWGAIQGPLAQLFAIPFLRTMVFRDPHWDPATFDWDKDVARVDRAVAANVTALSPDLRRFAARGGKLIIYQGWGDQLNGQALPIEYRQRVIDFLTTHGRADAESDVDAFMRLFMAPGLAHCFGGPGFVDFDSLDALERWVETGAAPDRIRARRALTPAPGQTPNDRSERPLCAYPRYARYTGAGSAEDPANFQCSPSDPARGGTP